jgi:hypothetical protein
MDGQDGASQGWGAMPIEPHIRVQGVEYYLRKICPWYGLLCLTILHTFPAGGQSHYHGWRNPWSPWRTSFLMFCAFYLVNIWLWHGMILQPARGRPAWSQSKLQDPGKVGCATGLYLTIVMCTIPLLTMPIPAPPELTESAWRTMIALGTMTLMFQTLTGGWMAMRLYNDFAAMND